MKSRDLLEEILSSLTEEMDSSNSYDVNHNSKNSWTLKKVSDGTEYEVKKSPQGNLTCTCTGYRYNHKCKHVDIVKEMFPGEFEEKKRHPMSEMPLDLMHSVLDKYDSNWTLLGSGRRGKDTFKDIDTLVNVSVEDFHKLADELKATDGFKITVAGDDILRGTLNGYELDINRVNDEKQDAGAMLLYRTGPADLNTFMRRVAMGIGGSLSEKGLVDHVTGSYIIPKGSSEEDYFKALGLPVLTPNQREEWRKYIDEESEIAKATKKQDEIIKGEKWIWDLAKDYQKAMQEGLFSNTDNYLRKYAKKYAVSPTSREMNYAYHIALKRNGGSYIPNPKSKEGKEKAAKAVQQSLDL